MSLTRVLRVGLRSLCSALCALGIAGGLSLLAWADPPAAPDISDLPDGARLVVLTEPASPLVVLDVFFRVGQSDEGNFIGINSLVTRAWAAGSENRSAPLLQGDIARHGDGLGTSAEPDYVELWDISSADLFERTAQTVVTNLISTPLFEPAAVETARREQQHDLALRGDNLIDAVMDRVRFRAYGDSPYAEPVFGTPDSLHAIPADQVGPYYRKLFRPDRAVFVVAGPISAADAKHMIVGCIGAGGWDDTPAHSPAPRTDLAPPIPATMRESVINRHAPATYFAAGYLAPGIDGMDGRGAYPAMLVLDAVLGGGKGARLFALRDTPAAGAQPIGYEIHSVLEPSRVQSLWAAYVIGDQPTATVRDLVVAQLHALGSGTAPITQAELDRAKSYLKARHAEQRQQLRGRAFGAGWSEAMGLGADFDANYNDAIDGVTLDATNRMARKILGGNPAVVHTLPPVSAAP